MMTTTEKSFSSGDLMNFLENFQRKMEVSLEDTNASIETTNKIIDGRLNDLDDKVREVSEKMNVNEKKTEEVEARMDRRLTSLEIAMKKSLEIRRKSDKLRQIEKNLKSQQITRKEDDREVQIPEKMTEKTMEEDNRPEKTFRSSWAREMQWELDNAAEAADKTSGNKVRRQEKGNEHRNTNENGRKEWTEERIIPNSWEEEEKRNEKEEERRGRGTILKDRKMNVKVRKPPVITKWFGTVTSSDESEDDTKWSEVDNKKKREDKKKRQIKRKNELKTECATKASCMVSLGPISMRSIEYFMEGNKNFESAKISAVKEFLQYNLDYNQEELETLNIM